jgi:hypothetical protein
MMRQSQKRETPPGKYPAARTGRGGPDLGFHGITALPILALGGGHSQPHFLANGARQEAADGMRLPAGGLDQFLRRNAPWPFQQVEDLFRLAAMAGAGGLGWDLGALGAFSALLCWGGLLARLGLRGRDVGLPWRDAGLRVGFLLLGSSGAGLGGLFFGSEHRHRSFSSAVDYRGHDMDHSGARQKQANSAGFGTGDGMAMWNPQLASGGT